MPGSVEAVVTQAMMTIATLSGFADRTAWPSH